MTRHLAAAALLAATATLPAPALANWTCKIADVCMAGDMCRTPPEALPALVVEVTEGWALDLEGIDNPFLNGLTARGALPFVAVSADAQGFEAPAPAVVSVVIGEAGDLTVAVIDLSPGFALPMVYRGTCTPG